MKENKLELRMIGLVPYNLSPIQQGIQFGHSVVEYSLMEEYQEKYLDWAKNWKTFIILNGGTTNNQFKNGKFIGSLNQHYQTLIENDIDVSTFYEPDLGEQLTAITFIVDERVFNKEKYPDYNYRGPEGYYESMSNIYYEKMFGKDYQKILWMCNFLKQFKLI